MSLTTIQFLSITIKKILFWRYLLATILLVSFTGPCKVYTEYLLKTVKLQKYNITLCQNFTLSFVELFYK